MKTPSNWAYWKFVLLNTKTYNCFMEKGTPRQKEDVETALKYFKFLHGKGWKAKLEELRTADSQNVGPDKKVSKLPEKEEVEIIDIKKPNTNIIGIENIKKSDMLKQSTINFMFTK